MTAVRFDHHECDQHERAGADRAQYKRICETARRRLGQTIGEGSEPRCDAERAGPVQPLRRIELVAVRHRRNRERDRHRCKRDVEEEYRAPRQHVDEPAARHRRRRGRDRPDGRPSADCPSARFAFVHGADDRETAGYEECCTNALHCARGDQRIRVRREPASGRRQREDPDARNEYRAAAELVAHRSAHQHEGPEKEQVGVNDPLHCRDARAEFALNGG
ncbi:hypothetical protein D3C72_1211540 [compost metagenome]